MDCLIDVERNPAFAFQNVHHKVNHKLCNRELPMASREHYGSRLDSAVCRHDVLPNWTTVFVLCDKIGLEPEVAKVMASDQ